MLLADESEDALPLEHLVFRGSENMSSCMKKFVDFRGRSEIKYIDEICLHAIYKAIVRAERNGRPEALRDTSPS